MSLAIRELTTAKPTHAWLRTINVAFVPGPSTPMLDEVTRHLAEHFRQRGHTVPATPDHHTDVLVTTAPFAEPIGWREALLFTCRRRFNLSHTPTIFTVIHATPTKFQERLDYLRSALAKDPPAPADFAIPGLAPRAYRTLIEQGRRGGPIMALTRQLQAQSKSIRLILVVGDDRPQHAYYFDLVGANPRIEADDEDFFYEDMLLRIVTSVSTGEVTHHEVEREFIQREVWTSLSTPGAMRVAGRQLGRRHFFTEMVRVADLVHVPSISEAVASQYSEGCFATWDPKIGALIATVTGSARPVDKDNITEDELAVIMRVRADGMGAVVRRVEGKRNDPPSSEAVEMIDMDGALPRIALDAAWGASARVPVVRSKLHGHRGVASYDPRRVEFAPLDAPYYHYPVSCSTEAQARAIKAAFRRSEALRNPDDPRQVVFTVLPGHGLVMVEKWVAGTAPFQVLWEYMDAGYLEVENRVPQGPLDFAPGADGRRVLREE